MNKYETLIQKINRIRKQKSIQIPSRQLTQIFVDTCCEIIFPINSTANVPHSETGKFLKAEYLLKNLLLPICDKLELQNSEICHSYFKQFPDLTQMLVSDAQAIYDFDPAATSIEEVIAAYPGFYSIMVYRLSHTLYRLKIPIIPRLMSEYAHSRTGIEINPGAKIGKSFFIDHGTGIVIGETCVIHDQVKIYQGVTLGALQVKKSMAKQKRHPTVENNVTIYSNSTILGGETTIGENSIIGGNVFLTKSVPANSLVRHQSEIKVLSQIKTTNPIDFQI